jgi:hypothetical protein
MRLGKYVKSPIEVKRYSIDQSNWLDTGEYIQSVSFTVTPATTNALYAVASAISGSSTLFTFFVSGGDDNNTYDVVARMVTTGGQVKEDSILYTVRST